MGAAVATLLSMILNTFLARRALSRIITIKVERESLLNILKASAVMVLFLGFYRWSVSLSNVWVTLLPVLLGGAFFAILMLKLDKKIYDDLKTIVTQMNLPWPYWI